MKQFRKTVRLSVCFSEQRHVASEKFSESRSAVDWLLIFDRSMCDMSPATDCQPVTPLWVTLQKPSAGGECAQPTCSVSCHCSSEPAGGICSCLACGLLSFINAHISEYKDMPGPELLEFWASLSMENSSGPSKQGLGFGKTRNLSPLWCHRISGGEANKLKSNLMECFHLGRKVNVLLAKRPFRIIFANTLLTLKSNYVNPVN